MCIEGILWVEGRRYSAYTEGVCVGGKLRGNFSQDLRCIRYSAMFVPILFVWVCRRKELGRQTLAGFSCTMLTVYALVTCCATPFTQFRPIE